MNVTKVATADFPYAGKRVKKGDEIELPRMDARVLEAIGKVGDMPAKAKKPVVEKVVEKVEEEPTEENTRPEKGKYHTKDMKAE